MATFTCGDRLRYGHFEPGASGCLVRFPEFGDHVLMLAAGHVVLPPFARAGDGIMRSDSDDILGRLFTWTSIDGDPTSDAALIWVDPERVSPHLRGLGLPSGINLNPTTGMRVVIVPSAGQSRVREAEISAVDQDVEVLVVGPGWESTPRVTYRSQIVTDSMISEGGDSGSIVLDIQNRVVGMVVAGRPGVGTVITPIASIFGNAAWGGRQLELITAIDGNAVAPPLPSVIDFQEPDINFDWLTADQMTVARQVATLLKAGGFGIAQQAAALGNCVAESGLNPLARNNSAIEDSVGLFQLNRRNGRGAGRSVEELQRTEVQCQIVLAWAANAPAFMNATGVDDAVAEFVTDFERPANAKAQIIKRQVIAHKFLSL